MARYIAFTIESPENYNIYAFFEAWKDFLKEASTGEPLTHRLEVAGDNKYYLVVETPRQLKAHDYSMIFQAARAFWAGWRAREMFGVG